MVCGRAGPSIKYRADFSAQIECVKRKRSTLRFSKEIVADNAAELKWRKKLLRLIGTRLRDAKRNQNTSEIKRLRKMQTKLRQTPAAYLLHLQSPGADHPEVRAAIHRVIKTGRQAIKRKLESKNQRLTEKKRTALLDKRRDLADIESQLFGVIHKSPKLFAEYGGRFPTPDDIIHNAVIWRCLESGKPHLILPKLAAMFPEYYAARLAEEVKRDPKVRRVVHRMKAGQIKGEYHDPVERLIAENYFDSSKLPKPLCRLSRDDAVEQLQKHFQKRITVDTYRRRVKSLFLREYS